MTNPLTRVGNYQIDQEIGQGGMSKVWLAHHRLLENRKVAIKMLLSDDQESIERFTREANITSRLRHEYIIQIYDHGYQHPYHYTVMEYVQGGALRDLLKGHRPLPLELVLHIFRRAGAALDYAHAHGVIHRDISPGNILVEQGSDRILLTDFGIARESGKAGMTTINKFMGTPGYLSPEQATSAASVTHLSDIYSLGVVLFEMLSGALPWNYNPGMPDRSGGVFAPPLPLRARGVQLPSEVDHIIETMLALEPAKRYPSAQAAIDDLDRVLSRHTSPTQIVMPTAGPPSAAAGGVAARRAVQTPAVEQHPVEKALGPDLVKAPIQEARKRAEALRDEQEIAALLNRWSAEGFFRRKLLGRQAAIHRITSSNAFFYTLRVLYETREPIKTIEEPDHKAQPVQLEKEEDRWSVELPAPKGFVDEAGGILRLPGSTRVIACEKCNGIGRTICPRCQGKQRIPDPNPAPKADGALAALDAASPRGATGPFGGATTAAPARPKLALIPCPECSGVGGLPCPRCDSVGRLVQKKTTTWRRRTATLKDNDNLPRVDEQWLQRVCQPVEVYREQYKGGFREEWRLVPALAELIGESRAAADANTRVILSEVVLEFIPVTEIVFDLGDVPAPPTTSSGKGKTAPRAAEADLYCWHIYGFEKRLPKDWRFLNWAQVAMVVLACALAIAVALIVFLLLRL
ncbi:MAG TPA: serine/threonine-protein kinase [Roseiflexaceae bacterium]